MSEFGYEADYPAMSEVSPLYPQQPASKRRSPLSRRLRLLHLREQTFLVVPPNDRL